MVRPVSLGIRAIVFMGSVWGTLSCELALGLEDDPKHAPCTSSESRCNHGVRQTCGEDLIWVDEPCTKEAPVCSVGKCVTVESISAGGSHTCAVLSDRRVQCWGLNNEGQLGRETPGSSNDDEVKFEPSPDAVVGLTHVQKVATGGSYDGGHSCALLEDGRVACWGRNNSYQLGNGTREPRSEPAVIDGLTDVEDLALGFERSCALRKDGTVLCWGFNLFGVLIPSNEQLWITTPEQFPGLSEVAQISLGTRHACARSKGGAVTCWGSNITGQVGNPETYEEETIGVSVVAGVEAKRISLGDYHTCVIANNDQVYCWGRDQCGQLGDNEACEATAQCNGPVGETEAESCGKPQPRAVLDQLGHPIAAEIISMGSYHSCSQNYSHDINCWGRNDYLQTGQDSEFLPNIEYVDQVIGLIVEQVKQLEAGSYHGCALRLAGDVWCWGRNDVGQLGRGTQSKAEKAGAVDWSQ